MDIVDDFVQCLLSYRIELVCFDFDETITVNDKRWVSKTFQCLSKSLWRAGIHQAITTFNLGYDIHELLRRRDAVFDKIHLPIIRRVSRLDFAFGKYWHITRAMERFGLRISQCNNSHVLLIDDFENNVNWARKFGICALEVAKKKGLSLEDLLRCMANSAFYFPPHLSTFIPSVSQAPTWLRGKRLKMISSVDAMTNETGIVNLVVKKDCAGHLFLLALCALPQTDNQWFHYSPFLVVESRIKRFLKSVSFNV
jgi:hypothetical protein